ncbi:type II secretion system protein N [Sphingosinithalassobacter portus]|uniref:type II secretion system protein N n=1 Tax=Stakelama portus TaxID=2676234 RepID=UPI00137B0DC9|nr:type II secretion system protein N [Sphingosinithalassobacter portus]
MPKLGRGISPLALLALPGAVALLAIFCFTRSNDRNPLAPGQVIVAGTPDSQATGLLDSPPSGQRKLTLLATLSGPQDGRQNALVAVGDGKPQFYRIGDRIAPGITLKSVATDHADILENGVERRLALRSAATSPSPQEQQSDPRMHALFANLRHHGRLRAGSRKTFRSNDPSTAQDH